MIYLAVSMVLFVGATIASLIACRDAEEEDYLTYMFISVVIFIVPMLIIVGATTTIFYEIGMYNYPHGNVPESVCNNITMCSNGTNDMHIIAWIGSTVFAAIGNASVAKFLFNR